jgi:hypothetical protein
MVKVAARPGQPRGGGWRVGGVAMIQAFIMMMVDIGPWRHPHQC